MISRLAIVAQESAYYAGLSGLPTMNCFACTKDPISLSSFSPFELVSCFLGEDRGAEFPAAEDGARPGRRPRRKERKSTAVHYVGSNSTV